DRVVLADLGYALDVARAANAVVAERIEDGRGPERRHVVAAEAQLTRVAVKADRRATIPELGVRGAGVGGDARAQVEARLEAATQVFDALEASFAAVDTAGLFGPLLRPAVVLQILAADVEVSDELDRPLCRCDARKSVQ